MPVVQAGSINTTALIVPDVYVQIVPPSVALLNGLPTNILGAVGTATWGPVNSPTTVGSMADYAQKFGAIQARKYDMGTFVAAAVLQGANNFRCVRVTDGTDVAASTTITAGTAAVATAIAAAINNGLSVMRGASNLAVASSSTTIVTVTAKYTGSLGNNVQVTTSAGSAANTTKVTIALPGLTPEVFDNIPGAATAGTTTMVGGTDGATTITGTTLVGVDTVPRKGMYCLRNTFTSIAALVDCDDSTTWATQVAFGLSEGVYMIGTGPAGDTIANATAAKATAGIDSYAFKLLFGDWVYFLDTVNGVTRVISPQGFIAGLLANLSPQNSSLNKPLYGVVATQKSILNQTYSAAELQSLGQAGIDVVTNPVPGGSYFGARFGHNSSSNAVINGDNYTRMTNYIAYSLNAGMGKFVGQLQSLTVQRQARSTISTSLDNMWGQGMIGNSLGTVPYSVQLDAGNNPQSRVALGYMQADVKVQYLSVIEKFLINVEGGQSVQIVRQSTALA
ncbi:phage tail protein [Burkholderia pseudomallei]|uniref:tail protein n=1 Tax=Burkholderia pseudomallei TaxID=28450 RepID=UPI000324A706|nr:tail protein [Burkholderia pseudomallei]AJX61969.1 phage tail sheath family protein [Burkholderia pseudomallei Pasteur 52237]MWA16592.1 phage tail protein [Burkholderia pseudomallei]OND79017.1 phage tail protein [Burkholderia pseudomallei]VBQ80875.1 phage tail sheath protein [Burkholderia pseudomallei]